MYLLNLWAEAAVEKSERARTERGRDFLWTVVFFNQKTNNLIDLFLK